MQSTKPPLLYIFGNADRWVLGNDDSFTVSVHVPKQENALYVVTNDELAELNPELPGSLLALLNYRHQRNEEPYAEGFLAYRTLQLLQSEFYIFKGMTGESYAVRDIENLSRGLFPDLMNITCYELVTSSTVDAVFVSNYYRSVLIVDRTDMDTRYPGWGQRWEVGQSLDLPKDELFTHVFNVEKPMTPSVGLPGLEFE